MHHALFLPEIIGKIIEANKSKAGFLYTCLFINKLFFAETVRILWSGCNSFFEADHPTPGIRNIAYIRSFDYDRRRLRSASLKGIPVTKILVSRAQFYANHIKVLRFHVEGDKNHDETRFMLSARWHNELASLSFPNLEELYIHKVDYLVGEKEKRSQYRLNHGRAILGYCGERLRALDVEACSNVTDWFLQELGDRSPALKKLRLKFREREQDGNEISTEALGVFLGKVNLEEIKIRSAGIGWGREIFEQLGQFPALKSLEVRDVEVEWIDGLLQLPIVSALFSKLKYWNAGISRRGLHALHSFAPNLLGITLPLADIPAEQCTDILSAAARFTQNEFLNVMFPASAKIHGEQLLNVAKSCTKLTTLIISEENGHKRPSGEGITDDLIGRLALYMPQIKTFHLAFTPAPGHETLSDKPMFSLCHNCPSLIDLTYSCYIDWPQSTNSQRGSILSKTLKNLTILPVRHWELRGNGLGLKLIAGDMMGKGFAETLPKLKWFSIEEPSEIEGYFEDGVLDFCLNRTSGSDTKGRYEEQDEE